MLSFAILLKKFFLHQLYQYQHKLISLLFSQTDSQTNLPTNLKRWKKDIMESFIQSDTLHSQIQVLSDKIIILENKVGQLELQLARVTLSIRRCDIHFRK